MYRQGEVLLYDSLFNGKIMPSTEVDLAQLFQPAIREGMLKVTVLPFQQQKAATDCGLSVSRLHTISHGAMTFPSCPSAKRA